MRFILFTFTRNKKHPPQQPHIATQNTLQVVLYLQFLFDVLKAILRHLSCFFYYMRRKVYTIRYLHHNDIVVLYIYHQKGVD